ncbi:MAG: DUF4367 domain-containing protein, partial [Ruminococcus sp.]|nr:DUF4367 domain-containing protein [Ruminococcus sp.]
LSGDDTSGNIDRLYEKIRDYERTARKPVNIFKRFVPVLCCFSLIFTANCVSVATCDMNIFSAVIKLTKGGFSIDFGKQPEEIYLPKSENDPYGFIAKLAEYDIEFETPHYIPDGFVLTEVDTNVNKDFANTVRFLFENRKQTLVIGYTKFWNEVVPMGIPSDHLNILETEVNGSPAIVSKEDNQYTIVYQKRKISFYMTAFDIPYNESEKIVASIK